MIVCLICGEQFKNSIPWQHLRKHGFAKPQDYKKQTGGKLVSPEYSQRLSKTGLEVQNRPEEKEKHRVKTIESWKKEEDKKNRKVGMGRYWDEISDGEYKERQEVCRKPWTPEKRKEQGEKLAKINGTPEKREFFSKIGKENNGTLEKRAFFSKDSKEKWKRPGYKEKQSQIQKEVQNRPEEKERKSKNQTEVWKRPGYKEKMSPIISKGQESCKGLKSVLMQKRWDDPIEADKLRLAQQGGLSGVPSSPHKILKDALIEAGVYDGFQSECWISNKSRCDEVNWQLKIAIEVNGCYWHDCRECFKEGEIQNERVRKNLENWKRKEETLKVKGFILIIVKEHDVYNKTSLGLTIEKIKKVIEERKSNVR